MRHVEGLNRSWRFHLGDELPEEALAFGIRGLINGETRVWQKTGNHGLSKPDNPVSDTWRVVDLPHDYAVEGEFKKSESRGHGSLSHGTAWYIRKFDLTDAEKGQRVHVEFDGVYRNCEIWLNGHFIGSHLSGYTSFGFDLTDYCLFGGVNSLAVRVDARQNELWSYEGAGIYRSVRLVVTDAVHVPQWGVYVRTGGEQKPGEVYARIEVANDGYDEVACEVICSVIDEAGEVRARSAVIPVDVAAFGRTEALALLEVANPSLWTPDDPRLYTFVSEIRIENETVDRFTQTFGFRYTKFDPENGFFLNGEHVKIRGVCCHQDSAGVGVAVPPSLQAWRVERLKDLGCNAIRTSHNPPDPALLDACDRLGMLVMDEHRMSGSSTEVLGQLSDLVLRDRNHPSVILWSIGNEEMGIQGTETGVAVFKRMKHLVAALDPTRPVTYAMNTMWIEICERYADDRPFDVFGANYRSDQNSARYDEFHAKHPDWPLIGSETWGGAATRGLYEPDRTTIPVEISDRWRENPKVWRDDEHRFFASAYGGTATPWGYSIEETWQDCATRPFMAGTFLWTGFDYRGETFPYEWPAVITRFGILDLCGYYKEVAHYLRSWWRQEVPHLFLMPHWNWHGREGEDIRVWCYGNAHTMELYLNSRSLGRKIMPELFRLEWTVPYEPGILEAIGYNSDGVETIRTSRTTSDAPAGIELSLWREQIRADGIDVTVVDVTISDRNGIECPLADDLVEFAVGGPVRILGVGNGNPVSHEPDKAPRRRAFHGRCQVILQSTGGEGVFALSASGRGLKPATVEGAASLDAAAPGADR